jgi:hypothetical protein
LKGSFIEKRKNRSEERGAEYSGKLLVNEKDYFEDA